jgi:hypothetical protein
MLLCTRQKKIGVISISFLLRDVMSEMTIKPGSEKTLVNWEWRLQFL